MSISAMDFGKVQSAIRIFESMGFTVGVGINNFEVYEDEYLLDSFKDGVEMYTAAIYYQKGVFHQMLDVKIAQED